MARRMVLNGLLVAISLVIFMLESLIPTVPIPGVKLGLANIVTLFAIYKIGYKDALAILCVRVFIAGVFCGQMMSFLYSITGGVLCWITMCLVKRFVKTEKMWITSVVGAVSHNVGQIAVAVVVMQTAEIVVYLPFLLVSGMVAGAFTGNCCGFMVKHLEKLKVV